MLVVAVLVVWLFCLVWVCLFVFVLVVVFVCLVVADTVCYLRLVWFYCCGFLRFDLVV